MRERRPVRATVKGGRARTAGALLTLFAAAFVLAANSFGHVGGKDKDGCHFDKKAGERHCHDKSGNTKRVSSCDGKVPAIGDEDVLYGRVTRVADGDTFKAKIQGAVMGFRMADIDAPEMEQPYGREAQKVLAAALDGKDVVMRRVDHDSYGRLIVQVWIANLHVNRELVTRGAAWFYPKFAHDNCLFEVENAARNAKRGLWALPLAQRKEPWVWREQKRDPTGGQQPKSSPVK